MTRLPLALATLLTVANVHAAGPPALTPPTPEVLTEARAIVATMKASDRGPYRYLRWYCKDGTEHPPTPYPCAERGGGNQHAAYSADRERLAQLGWSVGTIFRPMSAAELLDAAHRNQRLRELPLERYVTDIDDGWVLRRARYYRGRIQIEDEEDSGGRLLASILADPTWLADNFLLARESVRVVPNSAGAGDRTREVRRISKEISERDPTFETIRIKIHTAPQASDSALIQRWLEGASGRNAEPTLIAAARELIAALDLMYGVRGRADRLASAKKLLLKHRLDNLAVLLDGIMKLPADVRTRRLAALMSGIRDRVASSKDGAANTQLLAISIEAEGELMATTSGLLAEPWGTRAELLELAADLIEAGYGAGFLSPREQESLTAPLRRLTRRETASDVSSYLEAARALERAGGWGLGTVRYTYAEPLTRYQALEPRATMFADDVLRGSPLLPLARVSARLARDAEALSGLTHQLFGRQVGGLAGLNPGAAVGRLRMVSEEDLSRDVRLAPDEIVVLPQTVSELTPVAGIISLAEGNILSHVQLLARNLGIPNAALAPTFRSTLAAHDGHEVLFAIAGDGTIILSEVDEIPAAVLERVRPTRKVGDAAPTALVDAPKPDLTKRRPLPLVDLHSGLSGKVVGPKAANLGQLARTFPGRVEQAVALPFGIFADHASGGEDSPKARLDRAFAQYRDGEITIAERDAEIEVVRQQVTALELHPQLKKELTATFAEMFGPPGSYGVFVRSDTNVEDLPGFTGAGLNETLANIIGNDAIFRGVARVWGSPFTPRAVAWRARALSRPEEVYPSVLVMKSVPSTKSGVLVTTDLATNSAGITVAVAWGVGGAVDGDSAESVVLRPDGSSVLVAEAKAPYQRALSDQGGVRWDPAPAGAILDTDELAQLRAFAAEATEKLAPARGPGGKQLPWDVEFGFVNGRLTLFQVRPLVERGRTLANDIALELQPRRDKPQVVVDLDEPPRTIPTLPAGSSTSTRREP